MNQMSREFIRALAAGAIAVLLSVATGAVLGFTENPADFEYHRQFLQDYYAANPVNTSAQMDRVDAQIDAHAHPPAPPAIVAILQSNPALLFFFGLLCWLVTRAGRLHATVVTLVVAIALLAFNASVPAMAFAASLLAYLVFLYVFPRLRRRAA